MGAQHRYTSMKSHVIFNGLFERPLKGDDQMKINKWLLAISILLLTVVTFGCSSDKATQTNDSNDNGAIEGASSDEKEDMKAETKSGGEMRVGTSAQPPTLDPHQTTSIASFYVIAQMFEGLVTINSEFEVVPMLAESIEVSDDGKTYTFPLRQGVTFHNGEEVMAEDVVASMTRFQETSSSIPNVIREGTFSAKDDSTVIFEIEYASPTILSVLGASSAAVIMPKEIAEAADAESGIDEFIGTGPFKFVEWKQDQYVHLKKYEEYQALSDPADGRAGKKEALVDDLYFDIVPDAATLVAGVQSGQYDVALDVPNEYYEQLNSQDDLKVDVGDYGHMTLVFNKNEGWFKDEKVRQAVNATLDFEAILLAAFINKDLYRATSSYMQESQVLWYSDAGDPLYNQKDKEKAKKLLEEAGYNGEPIPLITTRDYQHIYNSSVVIKEQLAEIGMNVELEIYDWPTVATRTREPDKWQLYATGYALKPTPVELLYLNETYIDGPKDDKINGLLEEIVVAESNDIAKEKWDELQGYLWEYLPVIKLGDFTKISVTSKHIDGYDYFNGPMLWNTSNSK